MFTASTHEKPFWHGLPAQSSVSVSQESPSKPVTQAQVLPETVSSLPVISAQVPPFSQGLLTQASVSGVASTVAASVLAATVAAAREVSEALAAAAAEAAAFSASVWALAERAARLVRMTGWFS